MARCDDGYTNAGCGCSHGVDWSMAYDHDARLSSVKDPNRFTEARRYEPGRAEGDGRQAVGRTTVSAASRTATSLGFSGLIPQPFNSSRRTVKPPRWRSTRTGISFRS